MIDPADLRDIFDRAASLPSQDRAVFLSRACGDNVALRQEVERLLAADARAGLMFSDDSSDGGASPATPTAPPTGSLTGGAHLGPYVVIGSLGAGGMGEVYKARDTRLDRTVAIKVLPSDMVSSPEARQRFEREAKSAAALSHPHICRVLDVGREGATDYLVMEYLEGETLSARLSRGKLPLSQTLTIGVQIADALATAHRAGIVHRDLKPGNIMLTSNGAMLLDFGLARQTPLAMDGSTATIEGPITRTGAILGTLLYMAPEQLQGQTADARTDIFALGLLLFEMVTGRRAFEGTTHASVIANILHADPPALSLLDPAVPQAVDRIVRECVAKDPRERWQSALEVHARLDAVRDALNSGHLSGPTAREDLQRPNDVWKLSRLPWLRVGLPVGLFLLGVSVWLGFHRASSVDDTDTGSARRRLTRLAFEEMAGFATFSPDGRLIVYHSLAHGTTSLWVRPTSAGNAIQITRSPSNDLDPDWSPDGTAIVFSRSGEGLFVVPPTGGQERQLASFGRFPLWSPDSKQILFSLNAFSSSTKLFIVTPDQPPRQILEGFLQGGEWDLPAWHPDGRITIAGRHRTEGFGIYTVSLEDGRWARTLVPPEMLAANNVEHIFLPNWAPNGKFLYATLQTTGGIQNVWRFRLNDQLHISAMERVTTGPGSDWWPKVSRDGRRLLFTVITGNSRLWSFPFVPGGDAVGVPQPLSEEDGEINWASLSPDGTKLAYFYAPLTSSPDQSELRVTSFPFKEAPQRIAADRYVRMASAWSHSHDHLAVQAAELSSTGTLTGNVLLIRDESGSERPIARCQNISSEAPCSLEPAAWVANDSAVLVSSRLRGEQRTRLTLWSASVTTPAEAPAESVVSDSQWNLSRGTYSPDGQWLAFAYGGDYRNEQGIAIVPALRKVPQSSWEHLAAGFEATGNPRWSADGHFLYFTSSHDSISLNVWRVPISPDTGAPTGAPTEVTHLNSLGFFLLNRSYYPKIDVGSDRMILPMNSQKCAVWMVDNVDR
jgi:serine/threonine protein kinase